MARIAKDEMSEESLIVEQRRVGELKKVRLGEGEGEGEAKRAA